VVSQDKYWSRKLAESYRDSTINWGPCATAITYTGWHFLYFFFLAVLTYAVGCQEKVLIKEVGRILIEPWQSIGVHALQQLLTLGDITYLSFYCAVAFQDKWQKHVLDCCNAISIWMQFLPINHCHFWLWHTTIKF
jgi:hypothetical protein